MENEQDMFSNTGAAGEFMTPQQAPDETVKNNRPLTGSDALIANMDSMIAGTGAVQGYEAVRHLGYELFDPEMQQQDQKEQKEKIEWMEGYKNAVNGNSAFNSWPVRWAMDGIQLAANPINVITDGISGPLLKGLPKALDVVSPSLSKTANAIWDSGSSSFVGRTAQAATKALPVAAVGAAGQAALTNATTGVTGETENMKQYYQAVGNWVLWDGLFHIAGEGWRGAKVKFGLSENAGPIAGQSLDDDKTLDPHTPSEGIAEKVLQSSDQQPYLNEQLDKEIPAAQERGDKIKEDLQQTVNDYLNQDPSTEIHKDGATIGLDPVESDINSLTAPEHVALERKLKMISNTIPEASDILKPVNEKLNNSGVNIGTMSQARRVMTQVSNELDAQTKHKILDSNSWLLDPKVEIDRLKDKLNDLDEENKNLIQKRIMALSILGKHAKVYDKNSANWLNDLQENGVKQTDNPFAKFIHKVHGMAQDMQAEYDQSKKAAAVQNYINNGTPDIATVINRRVNELASGQAELGRNTAVPHLDWVADDSAPYKPQPTDIKEAEEKIRKFYVEHPDAADDETALEPVKAQFTQKILSRGLDNYADKVAKCLSGSLRDDERSVDSKDKYVNKIKQVDAAWSSAENNLRGKNGD